MLQSAREWRSTPVEAQKFGLQQHPGKQNKIDLSTLNCLEAYFLKKISLGKLYKKKTQKQKRIAIGWRLDDENEDDGDDDDTRELKNHDEVHDDDVC